MDDDLTASTAASRAVRDAARINRAEISLRAGAVAAFPVAAVLAIGTLAGQPVAAVTMGAGAMLAGVAWRGGGGPRIPPVGTMVAAAGGLALATVAGTLSGSQPWLHLGLLAAICLAAGLLTTLGRRGGVVGVQTVIAFIVFGRFPENVGGAFTLAGLALGGSAVQIAFAAVIARPATWRQQRGAVAAGYRELAELASDPTRSYRPVAVSLDEAEHLLSGPALFADPAAITLSSLVEEARRIRLELVSLRALREDPDVAPRLRLARRVLDLIATTIENRGRSDVALDTLSEQIGALRPQSPRSPARRGATEARLAALAGQLRAAARLTTQSSRPPGLRYLAHPTQGSRLPLSHLPSDLRRLRASASLSSATGRHAVRLAAAVSLTELIAQQAPLPRGYWAVVAAATALRPEFGATFTRGAERMLGTTVGVIAATLLAVAIQPSGWATVGIIAILACLTYTVFPASFAAGTAGITTVIVFLLHPVAPDSVQIAFDRGIDTAIGGAVGAGVYVLWPTWSGRSAERLLADVVESQRRYLRAVIGYVVDGGAPDESELRRLARRARIAYSDAESAVTLTQSEPVRGIEPRLAGASLVGLRRLVYAIHALRADLMTRSQLRPVPELTQLAGELDRALELVHERLTLAEERLTPTLPPLRDLYRQALDALSSTPRAPILAPLDELIDTVNTVATGLGLHLP
jgi:uncharacterized membrane protein YccC